MKTFEELLVKEIRKLPASRVRDAMEYSLCAGGKRIRPTLLYLAAEGYGLDSRAADAYACALEMIHTYSLIHDDLPAMDNDDLRRGMPTCHKQFDEATAILAGDGLLTYAFSVCAAADTEASIKSACIGVLADMAGAAGMVLGQCYDLDEDFKQDFEALRTVHKYKTGCLLTAPLLMGCILASHDEDRELWQQIGIDLGLAFQIQDDIFDVRLTEEEFGKSISDARNDKKTSISMLGIEKCEALMNELYGSVIRRLDEVKDFDPSAMKEFVRKVQYRNK